MPWTDRRLDTSRLVAGQHACSMAMARIGPLAPQARLRSSAVPLPTTRVPPRAPFCKLHASSSTPLHKLKPLQQTPSRANRYKTIVQPKAIFYGGFPTGPSGRSNFDRVAAASPQARQALLSNAISSCTNWRQLEGLIEQYGNYFTANNISHCLTRLEQVLAGQQLSAGEAAEVEELLQWLLQQGRALNATGQLGPQALGATAGALARLQEAQRQQQRRRHQEQQLLARQRQQQQQQQQMLAQQRLQQLQQEEAEERAKQAAAEADRRQLMQQLVDAAVAQRSRLTPRALDNVLAGLASIDESGMSADEIRQLLNIPKRVSSSSGSRLPPGTLSLDAQQQQQQAEAAAQLRRQQQEQGRQQHQQQQQQQQQQAVAPGDLRAAARQLGQLSPELAQEWHDRALRQSLEQGTLPAGLDQRYLSGFLAREIDRAAERARDSTSSSSASGRGVPITGAALLAGVLVRYAQLLRPPHFALIGHKLAELQEEGLAGSKQEVEAVASQLFQLCQSCIQLADAASISSLVSSCKELGLYSKTLLSAALARAKIILQAQLQGYQQQEEGFSARQLGVLLHSLAVLGLKPSDACLRVAVLAAGELLPSCSLTDLERLASSFVLMRINPGRDFTTAAEAQLEQLAAAIGSSRGRDPARTRALVGLDEDAEEDDSDTEESAEHAAVNARKALVACVKAVALLGGQRAAGWYNNILAAEQLQQQQQREEEEAERQHLQQHVQEQQQQQQQQQRVIEEKKQHQRDLLMQQQQQEKGARVTNEEQLEKQLRKAVAQQQQQQQQQQRNKPHLHSHHRLQHKHKPDVATATGSSSSSKDEVNALSSLGELMSHALQQQQQQKPAASNNLPHATTSIQEAVVGTDSESTAESGASVFATQPSSSSSNVAAPRASTGDRNSAEAAAAQVESAAPAAWAAEQTARWADSEGRKLRPAAELQQRLDDSKELFGSSKRRSSSKKQQQQQQRKGDKDLSRDIEVHFDSKGSAATGKGQQQQQRSAADAASTLAALMAEVDQQEVAESAQQEVQRELDALAAAAEDGCMTAAAAAAAGGMSVEDIQAAADTVQQATQQLDELQRCQQQLHSRQQQQQHKAATGDDTSKHHKKDKRHKHRATAATAPSSDKTTAAAAPSKGRKPLGFSGEAVFVAAAKNLASAKPSRNYLLGCLEAISMQQTELKQQLAAKQAMEAVAGAVQRQRAAAALDSNPLAKQIAQLQADFDRARKRAADEKAGITAAAVADVTTKLLPLLDSFDAALAAQQSAAQQSAAEKGQGSGAGDAAQIHMVYQGLNNQLVSILKSQGVAVIGGDGADVVGSAFDPTHMEAVMRQPAPAGFADGDVLRVLRKGYAVGDKLVRPALVVVAYED